jgi:hypothetical protein
MRESLLYEALGSTQRPSGTPSADAVLTSPSAIAVAQFGHRLKTSEIDSVCRRARCCGPASQKAD